MNEYVQAITWFPILITYRLYFMIIFLSNGSYKGTVKCPIPKKIIFDLIRHLGSLMNYHGPKRSHLDTRVLYDPWSEHVHATHMYA